MINIQLIENRESFSSLRAEWNELLGRTSADTIFLTWEWQYSWWECYAQKHDALYIITIRDSRELIGILPLYRRLQRWLPLKPIHTLCFVGDGSWDSDYLDGFFVQGREDEILDYVWKWLRSTPSWNVLQLSGLPATSQTAGWARRVVESGEAICQNKDVPCLIADLPDSWDTYLASLKPRFRTKIRSTLRELSANYDVRFRSVESKSELQAGLEDLYKLHGERWETKGTEGVFLNPAKRRFYERFTELFLAKGWLAFDFLDLNGSPVACQICFKYRGTQFLLQEGFDPQFGSESVGIALRAMAFKKAIEDGVSRYDFLAGLGRHKTQWQAHLKECQTIVFGPRTVTNALYLRVPTLVDALKERVKAVLPARVLEMRRGTSAG